MLVLGFGLALRTINNGLGLLGLASLGLVQCSCFGNVTNCILKLQK